MKQLHAQAVVVGGGAGGFAVAYTLAKNNIKTILVEKNSGLGGTSVYGGVNCWEPGVAQGELHQIIQQKLFDIPNACAKVWTIHYCCTLIASLRMILQSILGDFLLPIPTRPMTKR